MPCWEHRRWPIRSAPSAGITSPASVVDTAHTEIKNLTLWFEGDTLARMEGGYFPEQDAALLLEMREFGFYNNPKEKKKGN